MKIVTSANGKKMFKLRRDDWEAIGKKAGWINGNIKTSQYSDSGLPDDTTISQKDDFIRKIQNDLYMSILSNIKGMKYNSLLELETKLQELSHWIVDHLPEGSAQ